jgi:hypothetical protein
MLELYAVKVWHLSGPRYFEMIEVRAHSARRAEDLARESFPGCMAAAQRIFDPMLPPGRYAVTKMRPRVAA